MISDQHVHNLKGLINQRFNFSNSQTHRVTKTRISSLTYIVRVYYNGILFHMLNQQFLAFCHFTVCGENGRFKYTHVYITKKNIQIVFKIT